MVAYSAVAEVSVSPGAMRKQPFDGVRSASYTPLPERTFASSSARVESHNMLDIKGTGYDSRQQDRL